MEKAFSRLTQYEMYLQYECWQGGGGFGGNDEKEEQDFARKSLMEFAIFGALFYGSYRILKIREREISAVSEV